MVFLALKSVNRPETNIVELEIEVDAAAFEEAVQESYLKNRERMNVPGFRKGKAPRKIIEKMYGAGFFYEDAVNSVHPSAYEKAVKETGITPVDNAKMDVISVDEKGLVFKATVTVKPEVELACYKELAADKVLCSVSDTEIDDEVDRIRQRNARLVAVEDRPAEKDDTVVMDFEGFVDGAAFEGGKGENHSLKLGSGQFIPGFEEQLIGKSAGDEAEVNVTFPEGYHEASLAGKNAVFKVKVHEIKKTELPLLDDEFAKDVSEFDTLGAYRDSLKEKMLHEKEHRAEHEFEEQVMDALIEGLKAEIPEVMFERQLDSIISDYEQRMRSQGMTLEGYLQYTGSDMTAFRKMFRELAERQVKVRLALEKVAETEQIVISDEELEAEYKRIAEQYKTDVEKIKPYIPAEDLMQDISVGKAAEFVKSHAAVSEITEEQAQKKAREKTEKAQKETAKAKPKSKAPAKTEPEKAEDDGKKAPEKAAVTENKDEAKAEDTQPEQKNPAKKPAAASRKKKDAE